MDNEPVRIMGQFMSASTIPSGGLKVTLVIPGELVQDCAAASLLAIRRQKAIITVNSYDKPDTKEDKTEQPKTKRRPGSPIK